VACHPKLWVSIVTAHLRGCAATVGTLRAKHERGGEAWSTFALRATVDNLRVACQP